MLNLTNFEIVQSADKQFFVRVVASENGETLMTSETYTRKHDAERAAKKFIRRIRWGRCPLVHVAPTPVAKKASRK